MIKHAESGADISILINDEGYMFAVCEQEKKFWSGKLELIPWPDAAAAATREAIKPLMEIARGNRSLMETMGFNSDMIDSLLR